MVSKPDPYYSFSIEEMVVDDLAELNRQIESLEHRPSSLKWIIMSAHSALQGSLAVCLQRSDGAQLLTPKHEVATYRRWEQERQTGQLIPSDPAPVDSFLNLFEKAKDRDRMGFLGGQPLDPSDEQRKSVEHLHRLRCDLAHSSATTLSVDVREVLRSVQDAIDITGFLIAEAQPLPLTFPELQEQAENHVVKLRQLINDVISRFT